MILCKQQTNKDLITFFHTACCSPVPTTWIKAIENGQFATWPGLTPKLIRKYLPSSEYTAKGHLKQERHGLQSTKKIKAIPSTNKKDKKEKDELFPNSETPNVKTNELIISLTTINELIVVYTDLTDRFPIQSSKGNNYILVAYHPDANVILVEPLINQTALQITKAWQKINDRLKKKQEQNHSIGLWTMSVVTI